MFVHVGLGMRPCRPLLPCVCAVVQAMKITFECCLGKFGLIGHVKQQIGLKYRKCACGSINVISREIVISHEILGGQIPWEYSWESITLSRDRATRIYERAVCVCNVNNSERTCDPCYQSGSLSRTHALLTGSRSVHLRRPHLCCHEHYRSN